MVSPVMPDDAAGWETRDRYGRPLATGADESLVAQQRLGNDRAVSPSLGALPVALEFQLVVQRAVLGARVRELASVARRAFAGVPGIELTSPSQPALAAGIVAFRTPGRSAAGIVEALAAEDRIIVGYVDDGSDSGAIRVSLHPANDDIDIDRCAHAIERRL
jgi:selenocysteine lyase/cysteine desulfurase